MTQPRIEHMTFRSGGDQSTQPSKPIPCGKTNYFNIKFFVNFPEWDLAQVIEYPPAKVWIIQSILHSRCICSLGYFPFQPMVHNWPIKGCGMCCLVSGRVRIPCCISKRVAYVVTGFPLKKYVTMTTSLTANSQYENQCVLEASLNKTNVPLLISPKLSKKAI